MATAAAATPAARAGESSAQATATTSAATAYHRVLLGGSTARATGAATGVGCLRGGVGGGRLSVWVSLHGERQNMSRFELFCVATSLSTRYAS